MQKQKGFTLLELLIVIGIIAILAGVAFVALDPLSRFRDARDAKRWSDVTAVLSSIKIDQVDNRGPYIYGVNFDATAAATVAGNAYQISNASTTVACNTSCSVVDQTVAGANDCVNLSGLATEGYLSTLPVNPNGSGSWSSALTGYYMRKNTNGSIVIGSCDAESPSTISVQR
ncbi:MAG: type II secretion system protein [Patescibacteria group bacterium]